MESTPDNLNPDQADLFFGDPAILPDWQCRFCANYEYARESAGFREAVSNARCQGTKGYHSGFVWALRDFLATNVPEFPDVPWQRIKMIRRTELLSRIEITTEGRPAAIRDFGTPEQYCSGVCSREIFGSLDDDASVVLHIDFSEHDAFLVREFAAAGVNESGPPRCGVLSTTQEPERAGTQLSRLDQSPWPPGAISETAQSLWPGC